MSKKLSVKKIAIPAAAMRERLVTKSVAWSVTGEDGEVQEFNGEVDVIVTGTRSWKDARDFSERLKVAAKTAGVTMGAVLLSEYLVFDGGEKLSLEQVNDLPEIAVYALLNAVYEVNPHLLKAQDEAAKLGNP